VDAVSNAAQALVVGGNKCIPRAETTGIGHWMRTRYQQQQHLRVTPVCFFSAQEKMSSTISRGSESTSLMLAPAAAFAKPCRIAARRPAIADAMAGQLQQPACVSATP
jgi:hypothetical protein